MGTAASAIPTKGIVVQGSDGTNARAIKTDTTGQVAVTLAAAPTTAVTGTFWQATQPVSAASLPLPTGAAQDATLTGGTVRTKVTDGTNNAAVKAASTAAAATDPAMVVAISPNNTVPVSLATAPTTPVTGTFWQATQPVSLATNTPVIAAGSALIGKVGIDQTTPGTTNQVSAVQNGTWTVQPGNTANTTAWLMRQQAQTTGGATPYQLISAATTNATSVKASAGTVYGIQLYNTGASAAFVKLYNKASAPTVGTDTPVKTIGIPAGGGNNVPLSDLGVAFGTGIALAITGLNTVADTTAVTLAQVTVNLDYV